MPKELIAPTAPGTWIADASCRNVSNPDLFFPGVPQTHSEVVAARQQLKEARQVCFACPVRTECRDYAIANPNLEGIWGGMTETQRTQMRRSMRRRPPVTRPTPAPVF